MRKIDRLRFSKWFSFIVIIALCNACAYSSMTQRATTSSGVKLGSSDVLFVMLSPDGSYGTTKYTGSGRLLATCVLQIVRQQYPLAQLIEVTSELDAIRQSKTQGATYLLSSQILHWEDRATAWSGLRSKVKVGLRLIRLDTGQLAASNEFEARNNSMTLFDSHPEDLLGENFEPAVFALFQ